jgi:hypothetical protein
VASQSLAGGAVVHVSGSDSLPVPGARVVLHRIGRDTQGPLDSTRTDASGRFRFRLTADSASIYLASAERGGVEYFSSPVRVGERADTTLRIVVADTSSTAPVTVEARHLVIGPPGADGTRSVLDLVVLRNPGDRTRVAPDTVRPTWSGALLRGSTGLEVGEGDVSARAVSRRDDRVLFFAPIPPGEKQLVAEYVLPAGVRETGLTLEQGPTRLNILATEPGMEVSGAGIVRADTQVIEGRNYQRWSGAAGSGTALRISFPRPPLSFNWLLPALVALVAGTLLLAGVYALRGGPAVAGDPAATADGLFTRLATLDAEYTGRESAVPGDEWNRYQQERARLKAELAAALRASSARR